MKVAALTSYGPTLANVRGPLLGAMVAAGHEVVASAPDCSPAVISELARLGVRHHRLALARRGLNPVRDIFYCVRVFRFLRHERIDVCFLYTIKPVVFGSLAARAAGLRGVYSLITGLGYTFMGGTTRARVLTQITQQLYTRALRRNRWVFFQNSDDRNLFIQQGLVSPEKTSIVNGSGVDLDFYAPTPVPEGPPVFLSIARLLKAKGIVEFVGAAQRVKARFPECRFRLIGRPETGPDAIGPEVVNSWVESGVLEYVPELWDVRPELNACTVYVLPSYREGTPRSVLEAMSCGRAIITTNAPGCRETVLDGVNGFLVPVKDIPALEQAMERFTAAPGLARQMGAASRRYAVEKYDVNTVNRLMLERMGLAAPK